MPEGAGGWEDSAHPSLRKWGLPVAQAVPGQAWAGGARGQQEVSYSSQWAYGGESVPGTACQARHLNFNPWAIVRVYRGEMTVSRGRWQWDGSDVA